MNEPRRLRRAGLLLAMLPGLLLALGSRPGPVEAQGQAAPAAPPPAARAAAPRLTVGEGADARTWSRAELLARPDAITLTLADPVYGRPMTYRAVPAADLLQPLALAPDTTVQARATDDFSIGIPANLLLARDPRGPRAFVAIEDPAVPWPTLPGQAAKPAAEWTSAGPYFLVWQLPPGASVGSEYWAYHLAALAAAPDPLQRWPQLAVGPEVPTGDPIRAGLQRYLELCIACHRFRGAGEGSQGPDLGQPMNPTQYLQPQALRQLIRDPAAVRHWPDMRMPGFDRARLSDPDLDAVIAWLGYKARNSP